MEKGDYFQAMVSIGFFFTEASHITFARFWQYCGIVHPKARSKIYPQLLSAHVVRNIHSLIIFTYLGALANRLDTDQNVPNGEARSGPSLFVEEEN